MLYSEEQNSSTKVFLENKRPQDVYVGIDIEDKSSLNDLSRNIYTLQACRTVRARASLYFTLYTSSQPN